jgi:cytochrome d ubiquinol oxidase subunit II
VLLKNGFAVKPDTGHVYMEPHKYFVNFIQMPIVLAVFLIGVVGVLWGIGKSFFCSQYTKGIWFAGIGTVLTVLGLLLNAGYNNTAYYPSNYDLQSSLTIFNSSSSKFTLTTMSIVSILVPFVLAYIILAWRAINRKKISIAEMKAESHVY